MRTVLLLLAGAGTGCILIGIAGVALGMSETLFVIFAAIAMALLGLALLFVEQAAVAREEREAGEADVLFVRFADGQRRQIAEAFGVPTSMLMADTDVAPNRIEIPIEGWKERRALETQFEAGHMTRGEFDRRMRQTFAKPDPFSLARDWFARMASAIRLHGRRP
ncbi:hypothetical protein [Parvibaculum sp.]|nr:hypothetical protein [Parvibaculum sp.]MDP1628836.1 hypothetical protein [Parvibaculum sp.]MDP3326653.1 hypothetical protein [Parvibaculum sp.]